MPDHVGMVIINLISIILILSILFVVKFYFKKNLNTFIILMLLTIPPIISIFRPGVYESGDFTVNVYKSMSFYSNLTEGNLIPQWAGNLNAIYGYPQFLFIYPLPFYIISIFHFIGFSYIFSLKLLIITTYFLSGIGMYLWVKEILKNEKAALVASIFYLYAPYHLVDMHFRISIGELCSFAILPFCFLFIYRLTKKITIKNFYILILSLALLTLSNQAIALVSFALLLSYFIFIWYLNNNLIKNLIVGISTFVLSLLLTCFYWIPVIYYSKFTHQIHFIKSVDLLNLSDLIYSSWRFGFLFQGPSGELSFLIGYVQIFIIILTIFFLFKKRFKSIHKKIVIYFTLTLIFTIFLTLDYSNFIWNNINILRNFQFSYRLLLLISIQVSILSGILAIYLKNKFVYIIIIFAILQTILNWGNRKVITQINDFNLYKNLPFSTSQGEGFQPAKPIWTNLTNFWMHEIPKYKLIDYNKNSEIKVLDITNTKHEYLIDAKENTTLIENTWYFIGWNAYLNGNKIQIYPDKNGVINFDLNKGAYYLILKYEATNLILLTRILSFSTFILLSLSFIYYYKKNKFI